MISPEKNYDTGIPMTLHESIGKLSSDYLIKLRNRFKYIPVVIQQQAAAQESIENKKYNKLKPTLDGLAGNKETQRDRQKKLKNIRKCEIFFVYLYFKIYKI